LDGMVLTMKGLQLLLQSMGIKIDPAQIEQAWAASKDALPQLAKAFEEIRASQARIEQQIGDLIVWRDRMERQATMETPDSIMIGSTVSIKPNGETN
jgi:hypothetical protein